MDTSSPTQSHTVARSTAYVPWDGEAAVPRNRHTVFSQSPRATQEQLMTLRSKAVAKCSSLELDHTEVDHDVFTQECVMHHMSLL